MGLSDTSIEVIGARALQGVGAAFILPSSLSIINAVFVGRSRAIAFAVWGATIGGMAALGPLVGGWLTTYASWHWAFFINVPIGILVLIGVLVLVPETRETGGVAGFPTRNRMQQPRIIPARVGGGLAEHAVIAHHSLPLR